MAGRSITRYRRCTNRQNGNGRKLKNSQKNFTSIFSQLFLSFGITLGVCIGLLYLTACIPTTAFRENMLASVKYLEEQENEKYRLIETDRRTQIDNYADVITWNIMYSIDGEDKWEELIIAPFYSDNVNQEYPMIRLLKERMEQEKQADTIYDRYWHGMMVILRPLFCCFTITQIRFIMLIVLTGLLFLLSIGLWKKKLKLFAGTLWTAAIIINYPMIAWCTEYQSTWFIMLGVSLAVLKYYKKPEQVACLSVVSGVCCAFFDFLTTETIAFVIPIAIVFCLWEKEGLWKNFRQCLLYLFVWGISWCIAYLGTLFTKWGFSTILLGQNRFFHAITMMFYRQGAESVYTEADRVLSQTELVSNATNSLQISQPITALLVNIRLMLGLSEKITLQELFFTILFLTGLIICIVYLFRKTGNQCILPFMLFLLGSIPVLRIIILHNHSLEHCFFVYRALFGTVVCGILGFVYIIDWNFLKSIYREKKKRKR